MRACFSKVRLGPTFVKLGQVVSTRTDIFSDAYIQVIIFEKRESLFLFRGAPAQLRRAESGGRRCACESVYQELCEGGPGSTVCAMEGGCSQMKAVGQIDLRSET